MQKFYRLGWFVVLIFCNVSLFAEEGFVSLMTVEPGDTWTENAKPLRGWVKYGGEATYVVEGDEIVGRRGPGANTFLCTENRYSNFILKYEFKYEISVNSGVQFRCNLRGNPEPGQNGVVSGYQCEIDDGEMTGLTGWIYDESRRNRWLEPPTPEVKDRVKKAQKPDDWNEMTIQCVGPSIKTWLNGVKIDDLMDIETNEGFFGLQVHSAPKGQLRWRKIRIKELAPTPWIPLYADGKFGDIEKKPVGTWEIQEDGSVYGKTETGESRDGMLLSKNTYKNFAVKVAFKKVAGNSGLYFRAVEVDKPYWLNGFQCEIEAGGVAAGLWEVGLGRGWVAKNEPVAAKTYKADDWNAVGTVAVGDHLVTFLNGQKIVDIVDPKCLKEGKTGLQLHGGGDQGYRFRDYYIMPLDDTAMELIAR